MSETLWLKPRVNIIGAGSGKTNLNAAPAPYDSPIVAHNVSLTDVHISQLRLFGGLKDSEQHHPGTCLHSRGDPACKNGRFGLNGLELGSSEGPHDNIEVGPDVEIVSCAMGMLGGDTTNMHVHDNNFHHNGGIEGFWHNFYFRRCGGRIENNWFHDSPTASPNCLPKPISRPLYARLSFISRSTCLTSFVQRRGTV